MCCERLPEHEVATFHLRLGELGSRPAPCTATKLGSFFWALEHAVDFSRHVSWGILASDDHTGVPKRTAACRMGSDNWLAASHRLK
jgi:hypothetical protein